METDDSGSNCHSVDSVTPAGCDHLAIFCDHDVGTTITLEMAGLQAEIGSEATPAFLGEKTDLSAGATRHPFTEVQQSFDD